MSRFVLLIASNLLGLSIFEALVSAAPIRLRIDPPVVKLVGPDARHHLLVTAETADGRLSDVTLAATYASENPAILKIERPAEIIARQDGSTHVTVRYHGESASVPVSVSDSRLQHVPSFLNDVEPLFTRIGCNQGACHGKGAGQNGFRLSLRGYAPEWDYFWLTREFEGRRICTAVPEDSLILRKPTGRAPHEGGKLFESGSREYGVLSQWIHAGAPGPLKTDPTIQHLEIYPENRILQAGQEQQLLVRAGFSNGNWQDVTWLSRFDSNDRAVASVDAGGKVCIRRPGVTAIRASFLGQVAVIVFTVPYEQPLLKPTVIKANNFIDNFIFNKLVALHIEPSDLCTDEIFLRRVFFDTIGLSPRPEEIRAFVADHHPDKRSRVIDGLLERPEYVDFWALQLADLFQNRKESDHDVRGSKGVRSFHEWLRRQVAMNRPWDAMVRDVLTAKGQVNENPAVGYFIVTVGEQQAQDSPVVSSTAQAFLGVRIGCAQCHNHPLEKYTQDDYYHFAGFFSRLKLERKEPHQGITKLLISAQDPNQNKNPPGVTQPRTGAFLKPQPLDQSIMDFKPEEDPRIKLAMWMTDTKNAHFSGAMVNRLWQHFFAIGLVEPVDDLRASNPPSNPELWQALNREFVGHGFNLKHMIRLMLNSRTYQLSSATAPENQRDHRFYSHYYVRRLPAEVFLDAIVQSTGIPEAFAGYPTGLRALQIPDPGLNSYFLSLFGRPQRITACACERNNDVTMPQLLHLFGGETIMKKITAPRGNLNGLVKSQKSSKAIVEDLFLLTLARLPLNAELNAIENALGTSESHEEVYKDLFWALLNSKEFAFNH